MKLIISILIAVAMLATAIIFMGATKPTGRLSILFMGLLLVVGLAIIHSWPVLRPISFRKWLNR
ncbi:MAG: hypothetical protein LH609_14880 [Rudanella sp.]|nr:hypothetical protein [Rudanella sp.]